MSMLLFMPWCRIDAAYQAGDISILPFDPQQPLAGVSTSAWGNVCEVLSSYKDIKGEPVDRAALIQFAGKTLTDDLSPEEVDVAGDLLTLACFSSLARREFFGFQFDYCNSDCFTLILQKFDAPDYAALSISRRDGRTLSAWKIRDISISVPVHCHIAKDVRLDRPLLDALVAHRATLPVDDWGRWQNAITCFNQANTDAGGGRDHVDWVLLCSGFQHLLDAKSKADDVACCFASTFLPTETIQAQNCARLAGRKLDPGTSLRYEWMREFYRVRGAFAHGRLNPQQPVAWKPHEHLLLATVAFPLLIKTLLAQAARLALTDDDKDHVACFERLAAMPDFFREPSDAKNNGDSHWRRLLDEHRHAKLSADLADGLLKTLSAAGWPDGVSEKTES